MRPRIHRQPHSLFPLYDLAFLGTHGVLSSPVKPLPVIITSGLVGWALLLSLFGILPEAPGWVRVALCLTTLLGTLWKLEELESLIGRKAFEIAAKQEPTWHQQQHRAKKIKRLLWIPLWVLIAPALWLLGAGAAGD
jgi:hypothetical protein